MNKTGGIGETANLLAVIAVAIMVLAIIAPVTSTLFAQASTAAGATGIEKIVIEHYNVIILLVLTFAVFIVLWVMNR